MNFDTYIVRAWVVPVVLLTLPAIVAGAVLGFYDGSTRAVGLTGLVLLAAVTVAAIVVRRRGRDLQRRMWARADGSPTTRRLRHRGPMPEDTRRRLHARLAELSGVPAPTMEDEEDDPAAADRVYADWVDEAISATRHEPVVRNEVTSYGTLRNAVGVRAWGIAIAIMVGAASAAVLIAVGTTVAVVPLALSAAMLAAWTLVLTETAVAHQAETYADALFRAVPRERSIQNA